MPEQPTDRIPLDDVRLALAILARLTHNAESIHEVAERYVAELPDVEGFSAATLAMVMKHNLSVFLDDLAEVTWSPQDDVLCAGADQPRATQ